MSRLRSPEIAARVLAWIFTRGRRQCGANLLGGAGAGMSPPGPHRRSLRRAAARHVARARCDHVTCSSTADTSQGGSMGRTAGWACSNPQATLPNGAPCPAHGSRTSGQIDGEHAHPWNTRYGIKSRASPAKRSAWIQLSSCLGTVVGSTSGGQRASLCKAYAGACRVTGGVRIAHAPF